MSLYKQPGSNCWHYRIYVPGSGRLGRKVLRGSCRTSDEASAKAVEHTLRMALGKSAPAETLHKMIDAILGTPARLGLPLGALAEEYARAVALSGKALSVHTLRDRRSACLRFATWAAAHWPAAAEAERVDRACAAAFSAALRADGARDKTRRNVISDLGTVWQALRRGRDGMPENPWPLAMPESQDGERGLPFSRDQERAVLAAADAPAADAWGWGLACRLARATGLRYGDVARLRWQDADLEAGVIRTTPAKTQRWSVAVEVPLPAALVARLREARPAECLGNVLPRMAECLPHGPWRHPFGRVLDAAGVDRARYTFHSWRHTFRTRLAEAGVSDEIARRLGGWTNDATAGRYDHDGRMAELRVAVESAAD